MGYDFNKYLKTYINVCDILDYDEEGDRLFFDKIEEVLDGVFDEEVFEIIALKMDEKNYMYTDIFVAYDSNKHPFEVEYVSNIVKRVFKEFGLLI